MRRKLAMRAAVGVCAASLATVAAGSTSSSAANPPNWAKPQIKTVVAHGLMGATSVRTFKPNAPLTVQTLTDLATGLQQEVGQLSSGSTKSAPADGGTTTTETTTGDPSSSSATMASLDRKL